MNGYEKLWRECFGLDPSDPMPRSSSFLLLAHMHKIREQPGLAELGPMMLRETLVRQYAWAVPTEEALDEIAKHAPLVELGCGTGYWASLLREKGVDIICYDEYPVGNPNVVNEWHSLPSEGINPKVVAFTEILRGGPEVLRKHRDRSLFLCWPPYDHPMAAEALKNWCGKTMIYVGEPPGCATANDDFFQQRELDFEQIATVQLPQWAAIHDDLSVWRRKSLGTAATKT